MILDKIKEKMPAMTDDHKYLARYLLEGASGFLTGVFLNATLLRPGGAHDKVKYMARYLTEGAVGFGVGRFLSRTLLRPTGDGTMDKISGEDPLVSRVQEILRNG